MGHVEALQSERHDLHCPFPGSRPRSQRHPEPATGRPQGSHLIPLLPSRGTRHGLGTGTQAAPAVTVGEQPGHVHVGPTVLGSWDSLARPRPVSTRGGGVLGRAGLDVQGGLLAGEEPEHGGGHGLHVDLPRRGMSARPRRPSRPPGTALATPLWPSVWRRNWRVVPGAGDTGAPPDPAARPPRALRGFTRRRLLGCTSAHAYTSGDSGVGTTLVTGCGLSTWPEAHRRPQQRRAAASWGQGRRCTQPFPEAASG